MNLKTQLRPLERGKRIMTFDHAMTFDASVPVTDSSPLWRDDEKYGIHPGRPLNYGAGRGGRGVMTHDGKTVDSTGAFLVGELERLDQTLNEPLVNIGWTRDMDLREDVTLADEVSSFTLSTYGSQGGTGGNAIGTGKAWVGKTTNQMTGVGLDISKIPHRLTPWGIETKWDIFELESAAKIGRPVDQQKYDGMMLKHSMDVDEQVYIGDTSLGVTGLVNNSLVTNVNNVVNGQAGGTAWQPGVNYVGKTPDEILSDFNTAITSVWTQSAYAVPPTRILMPPAQFGYIATQKVSLAGNEAILAYIERNNVTTRGGFGKLEIYPSKWCVGAGAAGTIGTINGHDRMVLYTKDKKRIRFPMTLLQRTPIQYDSVYHKTTHFCRLGVVEVVYPDMVGYFDGI